MGPSVGYRSIIVNDGSLKNTGLEFDITAQLVNTDDLNLELNVLGAIEKNELTEMPIDPATGKRKIINNKLCSSKRKSTYDYYMREYAGVNPENGYAQWYVNYDDKNGNGSRDAGEAIADLYEYKIENPNATIWRNY